MSRRPDRLLILKTGSTLPALRARRGDFEDWIAAAAGVPLDRFEVVDVSRGARLPDQAELGAVIVTGSPDSVADHHPWSEVAAHWLRDAVRREAAVLGICYGHQLLAHALGGRVGRNPAGREIGVHQVDLVADDPLFAGLTSPMRAYETHSDAVLELPRGARLLGRNDHTPIQAIAIGSRARGVQWHPEFDADILTGYLIERAGEIDAELGPGTAARLRRGVVELTEGSVLMKNFLRQIAGVL